MNRLVINNIGFSCCIVTYLNPIIREQLLLRVITAINHGLRMRYQAMAEAELFASHGTERILCGAVW